jgi:hypothetical protein
MMLMHFAPSGESHYRAPLRQLARAHGAGASGDVRLDVQAQLAPEPGNRHDPNAVAVHVDGKHVATSRAPTPKGASEPFSDSTDEAAG